MSDNIHIPKITNVSLAFYLFASPIRTIKTASSFFDILLLRSLKPPVQIESGTTESI